MLMFTLVFEAKEKLVLEKKTSCEVLGGKAKVRMKIVRKELFQSSLWRSVPWTICCVTVSSELSLLGREKG